MQKKNRSRMRDLKAIDQAGPELPDSSSQFRFQSSMLSSNTAFSLPVSFSQDR